MAAPSPHHSNGRTLTPERLVQVRLGERYSEMNTILGRIRRRRNGEPTARERARLAELKEQIADLKKGAR